MLIQSRLLHIRHLFIGLAFLLPTFITHANEKNRLQPFTSDGCSSFPNGTIKARDVWLACCTAHDFTYWQGGTYLERIKADNALKQCVTKVGKPFIAKLMLAGVRVGGTPYLPTSFRWGYGWPFFRGYKAVNDEEKKQIASQIKHISAQYNQLIKQGNNNTCPVPLHCKIL